MIMTPAISNMIRDNKTHQIDGIIYTSARDEMRSMDSSLLQLYHSGTITAENRAALQIDNRCKLTEKHVKRNVVKKICFFNTSFFCSICLPAADARALSLKPAQPGRY